MGPKKRIDFSDRRSHPLPHIWTPEWLASTGSACWRPCSTLLSSSTKLAAVHCPSAVPACQSRQGGAQQRAAARRRPRRQQQRAPGGGWRAYSRLAQVPGAPPPPAAAHVQVSELCACVRAGQCSRVRLSTCWVRLASNSPAGGFWGHCRGYFGRWGWVGGPGCYMPGLASQPASHEPR